MSLRVARLLSLVSCAGKTVEVVRVPDRPALAPVERGGERWSAGDAELPALRTVLPGLPSCGVKPGERLEAVLAVRRDGRVIDAAVREGPEPIAARTCLARAFRKASVARGASRLVKVTWTAGERPSARVMPLAGDPGCPLDETPALAPFPSLYPVVKSRLPEVAECHRRAGGQAAQARVHFAVGASGGVCRLAVRGPANDALRRCVAGVFEGLAFDRPASEGLSIVYPLALAPP